MTFLETYILLITQETCRKKSIFGFFMIFQIFMGFYRFYIFLFTIMKNKKNMYKVVLVHAWFLTNGLAMHFPYIEFQRGLKTGVSF